MLLRVGLFLHIDQQRPGREVPCHLSDWTPSAPKTLAWTLRKSRASVGQVGEAVQACGIGAVTADSSAFTRAVGPRSSRVQKEGCRFSVAAKGLSGVKV